MPWQLGSQLTASSCRALGCTSAFQPRPHSCPAAPCCCRLVAQSSPIPCALMDCSPPDSTVHGISQARVLEWVAFPFSRGLSQPRDQTQVSCIAGRFFSIWASSEAQFFLKGRSKQWPPPPVATIMDQSVHSQLLSSLTPSQLPSAFAWTTVLQLLFSHANLFLHLISFV